MRTFTKEQIDQIKRVLADSNVRVSVHVPKLKQGTVETWTPVIGSDDWIKKRIAAIRAVKMKSQSAFWKTQQLKLLKIRRQISPEYEAFISGGTK